MSMRTSGGVTRLMAVLVVFIVTGLGSACFGVQRPMVIYNSEGRASPGRNLSLYDIAATYFEGKELNGFEEALAKAQLLYVGQYAGDAAQANVLSVPERSAAVKDFLARGGTLMVDYNGLAQGAFVKFLADLGLKHPGSTEGEYYDVTVAPDVKHPVLSKPHKLSGDLGSAYGWWTGWQDSFTCLCCKKGEPDKASMLVASNVAGKGTIIVTQMFSIFRDEAGLPPTPATSPARRTPAGISSPPPRACRW